MTVFAIDDPEIVPMNPLARMLAFAGPPFRWPVAAYARSMNHWPAPLISKNDPNRMKM